MLKHIILRVFILLATLQTVQLVQAQTKADTEALEKIIGNFDKRPAAPGGVLTIKKNGTEIFSRAFGAADLEYNVPNTSQTLFEAGSVSKQFTASAVLLLVLEGKLSLTDDIRKYIPEMPVYEQPVTVEHLLSHTSGIKDWGTVAQMGGWPRTTRVYTMRDAEHIIFSQKSLNFPPGTEFAYSNSNHNLMVLLVERITKQSFTEFTRQRLFNKAGMKNTSWRTDFQETVSKRSIAYKKEQGHYYSFMPFENTYGHAGLITTTEDLLKWNDFMAAKGLGEEFDRLRLRQFVFPNGKKAEYACGALFIWTVNGFPEICHSGSTAGYRAWLAYYPEQKLSVAYLSNDASISSIYVARMVSDIFIGAKGSVVASAENPAAIEGKPSVNKTGVYKNEKNAKIIEIGMRGDSLYLAKEPEWNSMYNDPWKNGLRSFSFTEDGVLQVASPSGIERYRKKELLQNVLKDRLQQFTGRYFSKECEGEVRIEAVNNELFLVYDLGPHLKLKPLYADAYTAGFISDNNILVEFELGLQGVKSFSANLSQEQYVYSRADNILFNKTGK